jgi:putative DNA primase/helicase
MQQIHTGRAANGHAGHQERKDATKLIMQVALKLYGEPNKAFSRVGELRFGTRGSLSVDLKRAVWFDHEHGVGGGVLKLIEHRLGLKGADARQWLAEQGLVLPRRTGIEAVRGRLVATHDYCEADGTVRYQVLRYEPKRFKQRRPGHRPNDPHIYNLDGVEPLPYRLREVMEAIAQALPIVIVEGEKDCDCLTTIGIISSCNSGGANGWPKCITPYFRDAAIIIIGDNDDAGRKHVGKVAAALAPVAASVRVLDLTAHWPECPHKETFPIGSQPVAHGNSSTCCCRMLRRGRRRPEDKTGPGDQKPTNPTSMARGRSSCAEANEPGCCPRFWP